MYNKLNLLLILLTCAVAPLLAEIKILHGPYLQNLGENEVTIVWVSDKPSIGWLEIAPDDGSHFYATERQKIFDTKIGIKNTSRIHSVKLEGLKPATTYRYRVCAQEVISHEGHKVIYGDITTAFSYAKEANSFTTNDATKPSVSFAMVNDIHGRNDVLENMINQCNLETTDLFLFNGDMVSISDNEEQMFGGFMDKAVELFASNLPMYYCRGNHETRGAMAPNFKDYFNPKADELFYAFRQGPVCFLVLDCGEDKPDSDVEYYGITDYDNYRSKQALWLSEITQSDLYRNAPFKVVVCHMPPLRRLARRIGHIEEVHPCTKPG